MSLKVITVTNSPDHAMPLIRSLVANGWDYVLIQVPEWKGFGQKLIETYHYLKANPDVTEFIFCDAFDVVCLGNEDEFREKLRITDVMILSCERGLWPPTLIPFRDEYPNLDHGFNYINSGLYYSRSKEFIELFDKYPPFYEIDDQIWLNMFWLLMDDNNAQYVRMDNNQSIFNSHSFIQDGDYTYENGRVQILGNEPIFIHSNGKTVDEKLDAMMKL